MRRNLILSEAPLAYNKSASCSCRLALQDLNRALRGPKAGAPQPQQKQLQQQRAVPSACRLQPGYQHPAVPLEKAASASKVGPALQPSDLIEQSLQNLSLAAIPLHDCSWQKFFAVGLAVGRPKKLPPRCPQASAEAFRADAESCTANSTHRAADVACSGADAARAVPAAAGGAVPISRQPAHLMAAGNLSPCLAEVVL